MADTAPLIFERRLGGLYPANTAAEKALAAVEGRVRVRITRSQGNSRRLSLYWATLATAAPMLSERCEGDALDSALLHRVLKKRRGLVRIIKLPSGDVVEDFDSISFASMTEPERSEYVTWALETVAKWLGTSVSELTRETERTL